MLHITNSPHSLFLCTVLHIISAESMASLGEGHNSNLVFTNGHLPGSLHEEVSRDIATLDSFTKQSCSCKWIPRFQPHTIAKTGARDTTHLTWQTPHQRYELNGFPRSITQRSALSHQIVKVRGKGTDPSTNSSLPT